MIRVIAVLKSIQSKHFYLQFIINYADGLLKYRTMRPFLIFLIFSILIGRENHTEIQKRTFEKYYSNKPNVCYFFKTADSYFFVYFLKLLVFFGHLYVSCWQGTLNWTQGLIWKFWLSIQFIYKTEEQATCLYFSLSIVKTSRTSLKSLQNFANSSRLYVYLCNWNLVGHWL